MTKEDFIAAATAAARASSADSGFPAGVTVAQAALESAWGRSQLSRQAHNYFGIKAHGGLPSIELPTHEFEGGKLVQVAARFARYASMEACFADRDRLITRLSVYAEALACAGDPEAFIRALARHWATDPKYAEKLLSLYRAHGLDALDRPSI
ncbi:MAG: glycoside hydrolase family 73 protein [Terriglobales bacterium]